MSNLFLLLLFLFLPFNVFAQNIEARAVLRESEILLDNTDRLFIENEKEYHKTANQKSDSLRKLGYHIVETNDGTIDLARFRPSSGFFFNEIIKGIKVTNSNKKGENKISLFIDRNGTLIKAKADKISDRKITKMILQLIKREEFKNWEPANFNNRNVSCIFRFSIVVDSDFANYNMKNSYRLKIDNWHYPQ